MVWGAAATGARAATGSTGQGLALMQESLSELTRAELPLVVFNMARGQGDYFQATRGGGHGDYRLIVLAPLDVSEAVDLTQDAFQLADHWRNPVIVLGDYLLAHTQEAVELRPRDFAALPPKAWAADGTGGGRGRPRHVSSLGTTPGAKGIDPESFWKRLQAKHERDRAPRSRAARRSTSRTPSCWWWPSARSRASRGTPCASCAREGAARRLLPPDQPLALPERGARARGRAGAARRRARAERGPDDRRRPARAARAARRSSASAASRPTPRASASAPLLDPEERARAHRRGPLQ